jgi:CheY-like chemotaxis protein
MSVANIFSGEPRLVLVVAHPDPEYTATVARSFRRLGWEVRPARDADDVRRVARLRTPDLVVLAADLPGETGWLTCEKLRNELPGLRVVLVVDEPTPYLERFSQFVGAAALVSVYSAPAALLDMAGQTAVA